MNDSPIVADTRKIRTAISHQFGNEIEKYIAFLRSPKQHRKVSSPPVVREERSCGYADRGQKADIVKC